MTEFILDYWCFLPYLTLLSLLTVMSVREARGAEEIGSRKKPRIH